VGCSPEEGGGKFVSVVGVVIWRGGYVMGCPVDMRVAAGDGEDCLLSFWWGGVRPF